MSFALNASANEVLPNNWMAVMDGIAVQEDNLGSYIGLNSFDGGVFHHFTKDYSDMDGSSYSCSYYVQQKSPYEMVYHYCSVDYSADYY